MIKGIDVIGSFNSENKTEVDEIKSKAIDLIDTIAKYGKDPHRNEKASDFIELAAMLGVKSIFQTKQD